MPAVHNLLDARGVEIATALKKINGAVHLQTTHEKLGKTVNFNTMAKGRKPTPNHLKKLRGTDQPCYRHPEDSFEKLSTVTVPKQLTTRRAKQIFKAKSDQLIRFNVLTELDIEQLTIYSGLLDEYFTCQETIQADGLFIKSISKKGESVLIEHPASRLKRQLAEIINRLGSNFGFDPASRLKFKTTNEKPDPDGLMEFL